MDGWMDGWMLVHVFASPQSGLSSVPGLPSAAKHAPRCAPQSGASAKLPCWAASPISPVSCAPAATTTSTWGAAAAAHADEDGGADASQVCLGASIKGGRKAAQPPDNASAAPRCSREKKSDRNRNGELLSRKMQNTNRDWFWKLPFWHAQDHNFLLVFVFYIFYIYIYYIYIMFIIYYHYTLYIIYKYIYIWYDI